jgi:hypothetical protein
MPMWCLLWYLLLGIWAVLCASVKWKEG